MTGIFFRRGEDTQIYRHKRREHPAIEAEVKVLQLQAKEPPRFAGKWQEAREALEKMLPYRFQREHGPVNALILNF